MAPRCSTIFAPVVASVVEEGASALTVVAVALLCKVPTTDHQVVPRTHLAALVPVVHQLPTPLPRVEVLAVVSTPLKAKELVVLVETHRSTTGFPQHLVGLAVVATATMVLRAT